MMINPILKLLLLTSLIVAQLTGFTQENFLPGSIYTLNGNEIKGAIDYRGWKINPKTITFLDSTTFEHTDYSPQNIYGFKVNNQTYLSAITTKEISSDNVSKLDHFSNLTLENDTVFLTLVLGGSKSLLSQYTSESKLQFYIKSDSTYQLLKYKEYIGTNNGVTGQAKKTIYKGQLIIYLNDCNSLNGLISKTKYSLKELTYLFSEYFYCKGEVPISTKKKDKMEIEFSPLIGATITNLNFTSKEFDYLNNTNFSNSINFSTGIKLNFIIPSTLTRWSITSEITYSQYQFAEDYLGDPSFFTETRYTMEFAYSYINTDFFIQYKIPVKKAALFTKVGVTNGFMLKNHNLLTTQLTHGNNDPIYKESSINLNTRPYEVGLSAGLGMEIYKLTLEVRYKIGNGMSKNPIIGATTNTWVIFLGYVINKKASKQMF